MWRLRWSDCCQLQLNKALLKADIQLIGGDLDKAPLAYKDIETVIDAQRELVEGLVKFTPEIVRMADANREKGQEG